MSTVCCTNLSNASFSTVRIVLKYKNVYYNSINAHLPLSLCRSHDGDPALVLRLLRLALIERRDLHRGAREADDVADVGTLGADDGADGVVGDVQVGGLLGVAAALGSPCWIHTRIRRLTGIQSS